MKLRETIGVAAVLGVGALLALALLILPTRGEAPPEAAEEGGHGGRLLRDGDFALELWIFERDRPPELRAQASRSGVPLEPAEVDLSVTLKRLGGRIDRIAFAPREGTLVGDRTIDEPHSFDVEVVAREGGREHVFAYESYEGRVTLDAAVRREQGVETARAGPGPVRTTLVLHGHVAPNADATSHLAPRFPGIARGVFKRLGDRVEAGETLARIESNESLQAYDLRSAIAGTVIARDVAPGETVSPDRALFTVSDLSTVWVDVHVPRRDLAGVGPGLAAWIDGEDGLPPAAGRVDLVAAVGAESSQTVLARVALSNPEGRWRPGLFVRAEIVLDESEAAVTVAPSALQRGGEGEVVYVCEGDAFEARPVTLGRRDRERVEVLSGLGAGDCYAATGSFLLKADAGKSGASHDH